MVLLRFIRGIWFSEQEPNEILVGTAGLLFLGIYFLCIVYFKPEFAWEYHEAQRFRSIFEDLLTEILVYILGGLHALTGILYAIVWIRKILFD